MSNKILKFSADWCQPCKQLSKTMDALNLATLVEEVDIEKNEALAFEYKIRGVPTLVLLKDGKEYSRITGTKTAEQILQFAAG
jgi:thioredoxin 1